MWRLPIVALPSLALPCSGIAPGPPRPHYGAMDESAESRPHDQAEPVPDTRRVYPPAEVQARLEVSASGLRRLAGIYERAIGPLPRDERGRVWPEDAVEELERARALVRDQRAVSIEAALRGQEGPAAEDAPDAVSLPDRSGPSAAEAILEELRALRVLVEEQNRRIAELEEAVRTGRELEAPRDEPEPPQTGAETPEGIETPEAAEDTHAATERAPEGVQTEQPEDRGVWRRVARWFGFGLDRR